MKKKISTAIAGASLATGVVVGGFIAPPMAAFAADTTTSTTAAATARTPGQWITDSLKGLVDKGTITQAQSDAVASALKDAQPKGGPGGPGGHGGVGPVEVKAIASTLGISETDLQTELKTKSVATVAKEKNVDLQKVIDLLVTAENKRIDQEVTDGKLTSAEATTRKANTTTRVTESVNRVRGDGPKGGPNGDMPKPGDAPAAPSSTTPSSTTPTTAASA